MLGGCGVGVTGHLGGTYLFMGSAAPKLTPSGVIGGVRYPSATPIAAPCPFWGVL